MVVCLCILGSLPMIFELSMLRVVVPPVVVLVTLVLERAVISQRVLHVVKLGVELGKRIQHLVRLWYLRRRRCRW